MILFNRCANRSETDEAKSFHTAPIVTVEVSKSNRPNLMENEEVPAWAKAETVKDSTVPVTGATVTAAAQNF